MDEHHAFLCAIRENPKDVSLRLVYADWLEERGDPHGEYVRLRCLLDGMPKDSEQYSLLRAREQALRATCPAGWLAALEGPEPEWWLIGNVILERPHGFGGGEERRGTRHFSVGTKVYCEPAAWGDGYEQIRVIGRHRGSSRLVSMIIPSRWVTNWRAQRVFKPAVLRALRRLARGSWESREDVDRYLSFLRQREEEHRGTGRGEDRAEPFPMNCLPLPGK
jgi:uncharacterized protein (TIGR02996 family)